jgi:hypothetical protein
MNEPTREQVRSLTTQAVRMTVDDFAINGFAIPKNIEESITDKYLFCYYLVKFAQEQERERIISVAQSRLDHERSALAHNLYRWHAASEWHQARCGGMEDMLAAIRARGKE